MSLLIFTCCHHMVFPGTCGILNHSFVWFLFVVLFSLVVYVYSPVFSLTHFLLKLYHMFQ